MWLARIGSKRGDRLDFRRLVRADRRNVPEDRQTKLVANIDRGAETPVGQLGPESQADTHEQADDRSQKERLDQHRCDLNTVGRLRDPLDLVAANRFRRFDAVALAFFFLEQCIVA